MKNRSFGTALPDDLLRCCFHRVPEYDWMELLHECPWHVRSRLSEAHDVWKPVVGTDPMRDEYERDVYVLKYFEILLCPIVQAEIPIVVT